MSDVIVVNQPLRRRESKTGKVRYTIDVKSEPLIFNLDPRQLEQPVATAMANSLRERVQNIGVSAAPATLHYRKEAGYAFRAGAPWALKRYSGGKLGVMPPNQTSRAFNDSGRFAKSITAMAKAGKWVINVAANRLDPATGNVDRIWSRLVQLVPAFADQRELLQDPAVAQVMLRAVNALPIVAPMTHDEISAAKVKNLIAFAAQVLLKAVA